MKINIIAANDQVLPMVGN